MERTCGCSKKNMPVNNSMASLPAALAFVIYTAFLILPVYAILSYSYPWILSMSENLTDYIPAIRLSFTTSLISTFICFVFGTAAVFHTVNIKNRALKRFMEILFQLPVVFPPAIAGIGLLLVFGRNGIIGRVLVDWGIHISFSSKAVIIAQVFVSSPFYVQVMKSAIEAIPPQVYEASYLCGAGKLITIFKIILPMLSGHIISALTLSWVRAMGEFGATITFAGNLEGMTQTIPLKIYTLMQTDIKAASLLAAILLLLSFTMLVFVKIVSSKKEWSF